MISRSYGSVEPFDRAVKQLRQHFQLLLPPPNPPSAIKAEDGSSRFSTTENRGEKNLKINRIQ